MTCRRTVARLTTGLAAVALVTGTSLALQPGTAAAGEFGQHVRHCAQHHGFDGSHNPGMHQGAAGWDHADC